MSRLIVLSNRVKMPDNSPTAGGLAVALHDVLLSNACIWMGWNGDIVDNTDDFSRCQRGVTVGTSSQVSNQTVTYMTTALTKEQYQHFYCGFANNVLWPLSHERSDLISEASQDYAGYEAVNYLFAKQLKKIIEPDDVIWVHDYHFLSVAYYCRQLGIKNRIGFFLHIPFAPLSFWQPLKQSVDLIEHLTHYDVIGTQTQQDKAHCLDVIRHYLKGKILTGHASSSNTSKDIILNNSLLIDSTVNGLTMSASRSHQSTHYAESSVQLRLNLQSGHPEHCLSVNAYPIGVNVSKIQQQVSHLSSPLNASQKTVKSATQRIIAVDRIDHSKGLLERFSAYQCFLERYPNYQQQLEFLQIACPSRLDLAVYRQLYQKVRQTVDDVNQYFSSNQDHWQAITYSETVLNHEALMSQFWHSDIGWVNSLKDGMNLVAKEYIAAQNPDNPGVLLLSRFAGAAEQMQDAVIIDPHNSDSVIQGLKTALEMPLAERKLRHNKLLLGLQQHDLQAWQQDFLHDLYG